MLSYSSSICPGCSTGTAAKILPCLIEINAITPSKIKGKAVSSIIREEKNPEPALKHRARVPVRTSDDPCESKARISSFELCSKALLIVDNV